MSPSARLLNLVTEPDGSGLARYILEFDPKAPQTRVFRAEEIRTSLGVSGSLPFETPPAVEAASGPVLAPIPWPEGLAPAAQPPDPDRNAEDPLPPADALVVTWTVAEAEALADVLTPGQPRTAWLPYTHNYASKFVGKIRPGAPARQYGRLGVFATTKVNNQSVVCFKSDLHLSQDGPELPVRDLWAQIIAETGARLVITTGTAGGVGEHADLGDVVVTQTVRFDCKKTFAKADFANAVYTDPHSISTPELFHACIEDLIPVNAAQLPPDRRSARIWHATKTFVPSVITTDFFAFDDTTNRYGLQTDDPHGRAVEMGDAVLGLVAAQDLTQPPTWVIVRNASDPQIDGTLPIPQQAAVAARIYEKYGYWTTVNSAITTWALIAESPT
jgi:nucleoside phosphorylase